jgi:hypothetical protein
MTTPTTVLFGLTRVGTIQPWQGQELGTETGPHRSDASSRATHKTRFFDLFRVLLQSEPVLYCCAYGLAC